MSLPRPSPQPLPTILIVEDTPTVLKALSRMLEIKGYKVLTAVGGPEAIAVLEHVSVQVALIDVMMPCMDGATLAREIVARSSRTAMVFMTGDEAESVRTSGLPGPLLLKPFDLPQVVGAVGQALREHKGRAGLA